MALKVRDNIFSPPPEFGGAWRYDSLQVYFDTLADARDKGNGWDENDYAYDFCPLKESPWIIRSYAPEWQIAFLEPGAVPEVKRAFRKIEDGMIYELAFPAKQIFPIALKSGTTFGFALLINDNDNDYRKRGLTLTPQGTEPCMRPDLYPVMCLE